MFFSNFVIIFLGFPPVLSTKPPDMIFTPSPTAQSATITIGTDVCLLEHQYVIINCTTVSGSQPIKFSWTANSTHSRIISTNMNLNVSTPDIYTCIARNAFGSINASSRVERKIINSYMKLAFDFFNKRLPLAC